MNKILTKIIKPFSKSAHIILSKQHIGKTAKIIILNEDERRDENGRENNKK